MKLSKNCECCLSSYEPYKIDKDSDIFAHCCDASLVDENKEMIKPKGLCGFCNFKSVWYNHKPSHYKVGCRA